MGFGVYYTIIIRRTPQNSIGYYFADCSASEIPELKHQTRSASVLGFRVKFRISIAEARYIAEAGSM